MTEKEILRLIGRNIKRIRIEKNIAQFKLAAMCKFEKASMSRIESGSTNPTVLTLKKICVALNVHLTDILKTNTIDTPNKH